MLPLLPPRVDTLAGYGDRVRGLHTLRDSRDRMRLLAFPRGERISRFGEGEKLRSRESAGRWTLEVAGDRTRSYRIQASLATLRDRFRPCSVSVDGRELPAARWSYDRRTRVLDARFGGRDPVLAVEGCQGTR